MKMNWIMIALSTFNCFAVIFNKKWEILQLINNWFDYIYSFFINMRTKKYDNKFITNINVEHFQYLTIQKENDWKGVIEDITVTISNRTNISVVR